MPTILSTAEPPGNSHTVRAITHQSKHYLANQYNYKTALYTVQHGSTPNVTFSKKTVSRTESKNFNNPRGKYVFTVTPGQ